MKKDIEEKRDNDEQESSWAYICCISIAVVIIGLPLLYPLIKKLVGG